LDSSDALSAALLPAAISGRVLDNITADVAAFNAGSCIRRLCGGGDVGGIRCLGFARVRLSLGTAPARAERHFEDPVLRSGDHAVCLEGGRASLSSESIAMSANPTRSSIQSTQGLLSIDGFRIHDMLLV